MDVSQFEQAILKLAFETNTRITPASVAYYLGIPSRESNRLLGELLREGALELDSDEGGNLYYRVPHSFPGASLEQTQAQEPARQASPGLAGARRDPEHPILAAMVQAEDSPAQAEALSPRRFRPDEGRDGGARQALKPPPGAARSPYAASDSADHLPPHDSGYGAALFVGAAEEPVFDHPAVERRARQDHGPREGSLRHVLVGVTARPTEPDAWVGTCGASSVVVTTAARCEPKPLGESRPKIVACVEADEVERDRSHAMTYNAPAAQPMTWWSAQPQAHAGAMVLAGHGNLPATMDQLEQPEHQPGMALLLSLILCGTGQIYNGEVSKGIMMMVLCFLLWFVLLGWVVHIWSIVDAVVVAERINRRQHV